MDSYEPFLRSNIIYLLSLFSFGLGLTASRFNVRWLFPVLLVSVSLNFAFIFLKSQLPEPLINMYYGTAVLEDFADLGLTSAEQIPNLSRPRGLFSNPNGSAFLVNIIRYLFFWVSNTKYVLSPALVLFFIIISPLILSTLLASRGEFVVSLILAVLHYKAIYNDHLQKNRVSYVLRLNILVILIPLSLLLYLSQKVDLVELQSNINRVMSVLSVLENTNAQEAEVRELSGLARPLLTVVEALERFKASPIFGTGYASIQGHEYFSAGTDYFHNDWFRIFVTSGVIVLLQCCGLFGDLFYFLVGPF